MTATQAALESPIGPTCWPTDLVPPMLQTPDGASAALDGNRIIVRDPRGEPVAAYSVAAGLTVSATRGDLRLSAPEGRVVIEAAAGVAIETPAGLDLQAAELGLHTRRATLELEQATIVAERIATTAAEVVHTVGRWELSARRIVESARDAYREVEDLAQTRATRIRAIAADAYQLLAGRTAIVSDEDTVIDGKRVLLG